jgi:hypothetical protein
MAVNENNAWMNDVTAISEDGQVSSGKYDGYGRILDEDGDSVAEFCLDHPQISHTLCWEAAGRPTEWTGGSVSSPDQGWFFDEGDHDMPPPQVPAEAGNRLS